jgi:hypothetical protein
VRIEKLACQAARAPWISAPSPTRAHRRRTRRRRRGRSGRRRAEPARRRRPARGAATRTCCCRRCTRSRRASAGSPRGALGYLCERLHVPPAEAYGVATFYALFALAERPPVVHVCDDLACHAAGADALIAALTKRAGAPARRATARRGCRARASGCASARRRRCSRSPGEAPRAGRGAGRCGSRDALARSQAPTRPPAVPRSAVATAGVSRAPLLARVGRSTRRASTTTARTAATRRCARPRARAGFVLREVTDAGWSAAAARPSRPGASGRRSPRTPRARTTWCATPTRASPAPSRTAC